MRAFAGKPPMEIFSDIFGENFFYQLYFQKPGVAESEFDADPHGILSRLFCSPDTPRGPVKLTGPWTGEGGWIDRLGKPTELPSWLTQDDLDYYVDAFTRSGFAGGINYYRNINRNWEVMKAYADKKISCPVLFIAGTEDIAIVRADKQKLEKMMSPYVPDLTVNLLQDYGHWIQSEAAEQVNESMLSFLKEG